MLVLFGLYRYTVKMQDFNAYIFFVDTWTWAYFLHATRY